MTKKLINSSIYSCAPFLFIFIFYWKDAILVQFSDAAQLKEKEIFFSGGYNYDTRVGYAVGSDGDSRSAMRSVSRITVTAVETFSGCVAMATIWYTFSGNFERIAPILHKEANL